MSCCKLYASVKYVMRRRKLWTSFSDMLLPRYSSSSNVHTSKYGVPLSNIYELSSHLTQSLDTNAGNGEV
jgi:hypothetical protein